MRPATATLIAHTVLALSVIGSTLVLALSGDLSGGAAIGVIGGVAGVTGASTLGIAISAKPPA